MYLGILRIVKVPFYYIYALIFNDHAVSSRNDRSFKCSLRFFKRERLIKETFRLDHAFGKKFCGSEVFLRCGSERTDQLDLCRMDHTHRYRDWLIRMLG